MNAAYVLGGFVTAAGLWCPRCLSHAALEMCVAEIDEGGVGPPEYWRACSDDACDWAEKV